MKKPSKLEELGNLMHFWFTPSTFIKEWEKQGKPRNRVGEAFMYLFEGLRLTAYYALMANGIEKYL
jgi:hypothetical protein